MIEIPKLLVEAGNIAKEISPNNKIRIETKQGGYVAVAYEKEHKIVIRVNSWNKMTLFQKRVIMIHEMIHLLGLSHSDMGAGIAYRDGVAIDLYKRIYGEDEEYHKHIFTVSKKAELIYPQLKEVSK